MTTPSVVLVHGAFADSSSWNGVVERLRAEGIYTAAHANPLRSLSGDASSLRDLIQGVAAAKGAPVVVVAHSYGGMVATEAAADLDEVAGIVYVAAFAPDTGESAIDLSQRFPGSTLGDALFAVPLSDGGQDLRIRPDLFPQQFAADVAVEQTSLMAVAQRPVTAAALAEPLSAATPAWKQVPSWHVFGAEDRNIPAAVIRYMAQRAGSQGTTEISGAGHALSVSQPEAVTRTVLEAVRTVTRAAV